MLCERADGQAVSFIERLVEQSPRKELKHIDDNNFQLLLTGGRFAVTGGRFGVTGGRFAVTGGRFGVTGGSLPSFGDLCQTGQFST